MVLATQSGYLPEQPKAWEHEVWKEDGGGKKAQHPPTWDQI